MTEREKLILFKGGEVVYSTNVFIDIPVILQYDDTPLIEAVQSIEAGASELSFSVYDESGDKLAVVQGTRIHKTEAGETAGWDIRQEARLVACQVGGRTLFEVRRDAPHRLAVSADLFTPDGRFLKASADEYLNAYAKDEPWQIGGLTMMNNVFRGFKIGVKLSSSGDVAIGAAG